MLAFDDRFCSRLLVNAVLAHASVSTLIGDDARLSPTLYGSITHATCSLQTSYAANPDRAQYWNPRNISYQFFAKTKRLWELERLREHSLTTLQAALVITLVLNMGGMDKLGMTYLMQAASMAHTLRLFDSSNTVHDIEVRNSRDFTAWGLFYLQRYGIRTSPPEEVVSARSLIRSLIQAWDAITF
jgi:hypothetical protein